MKAGVTLAALEKVVVTVQKAAYVANDAAVYLAYITVHCRLVSIALG
mgnify:FL=1|jgi:hypothetical protein